MVPVVPVKESKSPAALDVRIICRIKIFKKTMYMPLYLHIVKSYETKLTVKANIDAIRARLKINMIF